LKYCLKPYRIVYVQLLLGFDFDGETAFTLLQNDPEMPLVNLQPLNTATRTAVRG
jgi:hypothetical protein